MNMIRMPTSSLGRTSCATRHGYRWVMELRGWDLVPCVNRAGSGDDVYGYGPTGSDYDRADDLLREDTES